MSCTDPGTGSMVGSYELGVLTGTEKRRFEAHLLQCDHCFQELYRAESVASLVREERLAPDEPKGGDRDPAETDKTARAVRPAGRGFRFWAVAAATVVAAAAAFLVFRSLGPPDDTERLRGSEEAAIVVFAPIGTVPAPNELDWKVVPGADAYELRILTPSGELVWEGTTSEPPAQLPDSVREMLRPGETYFWQVEAISKSGERWRSQPTRFSVWR